MSVFAGKGVFAGDVTHENCQPRRLVPLLQAHGFTYASPKLTHGSKLENASADLKSWITGVRDGGGIPVVGWGVHDAAGDPIQEAINVYSRVEGWQLAGYIADLEDGFFYDGDTHGWGEQHAADEQVAYKATIAVLAALRDELGLEFPLAVTTLVRKDYPYAALAAADVDLMPQLYGARDPLPDALPALGDFQGRALAAAISASRIRPALWADQENPTPAAGEIRFLADAMNDDQFRSSR